jgi:hypothetical protein
MKWEQGWRSQPEISQGRAKAIVLDPKRGAASGGMFGLLAKGRWRMMRKGVRRMLSAEPPAPWIFF